MAAAGRRRIARRARAVAAGEHAGTRGGRVVRFRSVAPRGAVDGVAAVFASCAIYGVPYLKIRTERKIRIFVTALLATLGCCASCCSGKIFSAC